MRRVGEEEREYEREGWEEERSGEKRREDESKGEERKGRRVYELEEEK